MRLGRAVHWVVLAAVVGWPLIAARTCLAQQSGDGTNLNKEVDRLVVMIGRRQSSQQAVKRLGELGAEAVPRLVYHVKGQHRIRRLLALACLQYCWSDAAEGPVLAAAVSRDGQISRTALVVLRRHLTDERLEIALKRVADAGNPKMAGVAAAALLESEPNLDKMLALVRPRANWPQVGPLLPRYYSPKLTPATRLMLLHPQADVVRAAVCGAIRQQDADPRTRGRAVELLGHGKAEIRDIACEYLRWHGTADEVDALKTVEEDTDLYVRASARAAVAAIRRREKIFSKQGRAADISAGADPAEAYAVATKALTGRPNLATRQAAIDVLRRVQPLEPYARFDDEQGLSRAQARASLVRLVGGLTEVTGTPTQGDPAPARKLVPPVRDYSDPMRRSFGRATGDDGSAFANTIHVGDDVAWGKVHATVVSIGNGRVAGVRVAAPTWGGLVTIQHVDSDGEMFWSLYAHLGPMIDVCPGQIVTKGQKIGTTGRSMTHENGGYVTHLHFAICRGSADEGQATGYLSPEVFKAGKHHWADPQSFIRDRLDRAAPAARAASTRPSRPPAIPGSGDPAEARKKLAMAEMLLRNDRRHAAKRMLQEIVKAYPKSPAAEQAAKRLKEMAARE